MANDWCCLGRVRGYLSSGTWPVRDQGKFEECLGSVVGVWVCGCVYSVCVRSRRRVRSMRVGTHVACTPCKSSVRVQGYIGVLSTYEYIRSTCAYVLCGACTCRVHMYSILRILRILRTDECCSTITVVVHGVLCSTRTPCSVPQFVIHPRYSYISRAQRVKAVVT